MAITMSSSAIMSSSIEVGLPGHDLRSPIVRAAVNVLELEQLLLDERRDPRLVAEQHTQLRDPLLQVRVLVLDPLALEPGERAEPKVEDRLRLQLAEPKRSMRPVLASSASSDARISWMTSSRLSSAMR